MQTSIPETLLLAQRALENSSDLVFKDPKLAHLREQALAALKAALSPVRAEPVVGPDEMAALQACFATLGQPDGYVADAAVDMAAPSLGELLPFEEATFMPLAVTTVDSPATQGTLHSAPIPQAL